MEKVNIFSRFIRAASDFKFSNHFIREKTGKAFGFMFLGFLLFVIFSTSMYGLFTTKDIEKGIDEFSATIEAMPDFALTPDGVEFEGGVHQGTYVGDGYEIVVDTDPIARLTLENDPEIVRIYIDENGVYVNTNEVFEVKSLTETVSKEDILDVLGIIPTFTLIIMTIVIVMAVIPLLFLSLVAWVIALIVGFALNKELPGSACFKVGIYAMFVPNVILTLTLATPLSIPYFFFIYIGLVALYSFLFMKNYEEVEEDEELLDLFEEVVIEE